MKLLTTTLFLLIAFGVKAQDTIKRDTIRIPVEILVDKAVQAENGNYPYPRPVESYDGIEVQIQENDTIKQTLFFVGLINKEGKLVYQAIEQKDFKISKRKK